MQREKFKITWRNEPYFSIFGCSLIPIQSDASKITTFNNQVVQSGQPGLTSRVKELTSVTNNRKWKLYWTHNTRTG